MMGSSENCCPGKLNYLALSSPHLYCPPILSLRTEANMFMGYMHLASSHIPRIWKLKYSWQAKPLKTSNSSNIQWVLEAVYDFGKQDLIVWTLFWRNKLSVARGQVHGWRHTMNLRWNPHYTRGILSGGLLHFILPETNGQTTHTFVEYNVDM